MSGRFRIRCGATTVYLIGLKLFSEPFFQPVTQGFYRRFSGGRIRSNGYSTFFFFPFRIAANSGSDSQVRMVKGVVGTFVGDILRGKPILGGLSDHLHAGLGPRPIVSESNKDQHRHIGLKAFVDPTTERNAAWVKPRYGFEPDICCPD